MAWFEFVTSIRVLWKRVWVKLTSTLSLWNIDLEELQLFQIIHPSSNYTFIHAVHQSQESSFSFSKCVYLPYGLNKTHTKAYAG